MPSLRLVVSCATRKSVPRRATASAARIAEIRPSTPAAGAGLKAGDVVVEVDGKTISSGDDLTRVIDAHKPGDKISVTYKRGGSEHTVTLTLATRPS